MGLPIIFLCILAGDHGQDFFGEGDDDAAGQGQEAVGSLAGIVGLQGKTHLHDAPTQQDQTDGTDQAEDELTEIVHHSQRIRAGGGDGNRQGAGGADGQHRQGVAAEATLNPVGDGDTCDEAFFFFLKQIHGFGSPSYLVSLPARRDREAQSCVWRSQGLPPGTEACDPR